MREFFRSTARCISRRCRGRSSFRRENRFTRRGGGRGGRLRATIAVTITLIALTHAGCATGVPGTVKRCGVSFVLPSKWTAVENVSPDYPEETDIQCRVALRPEG